jgi:glycosyltransferase involved in cell wall biosynthesis
MKNFPLVSVIIIVKNGERFIRDALKSVYNQTYKQFEVIIIDGNSQDDTLSIVHEFEPDKIISQKGNGVSDAYNTGIKAASADIVSFLSSDDIWMTNKLADHLEYMVNNPKIMFTNSMIEYFLEPGSEIPSSFRKELLDKAYPARIMENLVAKKDVFETVGWFNTKLSTAEDVDWFSRAQDLKVSSHMLEKVLLKKRIHSRNTSMNTSVNNKNLMMVLRNAMKRKKDSSHTH